jgi:NifU-like protein involved in Fe-S cluster formation
VTERGGYSATASDHFRQPRNVGRLEDANAVGTIDDLASENLISFSLRIEGGRVAAARFRAFGCSACIAAGSIATELATGKALPEVRELDGARLLTALDGLPNELRYCADLAARALVAALDDYEHRASVE